jgi:hypothetical protein
MVISSRHILTVQPQKEIIMNDQTIFSDSPGISNDGTTWTVRINDKVLREMFSLAQEPVRETFWCIRFGQHSLVLRTHSTEPRGENVRVWRGNIPATPEVNATLVATQWDTRHPLISGHIQMGAARFVLNYSAPGFVNIRKETWLERHSCGTEAPDYKHPLNQMSLPSGASVADEDDTSVATITVLPVYGHAIQSAHKSPDEAQAVVESWVANAEAFTNTAFSNSGIAARTHYLKPLFLDVLKMDDVKVAIHIVGSPTSNGNPNDPLYIALAGARDKAQADVITMIFTPVKNGVSGIAGNIPQPASFDHSELRNACFAVASDSPQPFAHELGHLLGGMHDRYTQPADNDLNPAYDYARGYVHLAGKTDSFVTLMGYPGSIESRDVESIQYVQAFSAADRQWKGFPLGVPIGKPYAADSATLMRQSTKVIAAYRGSEAESLDLAHRVSLTLQVEPATGGIIVSSLPGPYTKNTVVTLQAKPRTGFVFDHWSQDGKSLTDATCLVKMNAAKSIQAHFREGNARNTLRVRVWEGFPDMLGIDTPKQMPASAYTVQATPSGPVPAGTMVNIKVSAHTDKGNYIYVGFCLDEALVSSSYNDLMKERTEADINLQVESDITVDIYFHHKPN